MNVINIRYKNVPADHNANEKNCISSVCSVTCPAISILNKAVNCVPIVTKNQLPFRISSKLLSSGLRYTNKMVNEESVIPAQRTIAANQKTYAMVCQPNSRETQMPVRLTNPTRE
ncbi:SAM-dependent methyltransferase [Candidatus Scalindua japonica]|uniref:SAM-dependent methyltransferase n=1 Tax=Candidatus Scalindua japonica TaxID=1284222 RepID=A0A286U079_9BACT|nr:SAM-dependent methyltransferase [Candidatus Scalindua japonica]